MVLDLPLGALNDQIDRGYRPDDRERRQQNISKERFAAVNHDLVAGVYPSRGRGALRIQEIDEELVLSAVVVLPEDSDLLTIRELIGAAGLSNRVGNGSLRAYCKDLRPAHLARDRHANQWLHDELRILFESSQKVPNIGLGSRERNSSDANGLIQRMGNGAIRPDNEIPAHLGLAPHHHPDRIPGGQGDLVSSRRSALGKDRRGDQRNRNEEQGLPEQLSHSLTDERL